jgi:hypothetical protein
MGNQVQGGIGLEYLQVWKSSTTLIRLVATTSEKYSANRYWTSTRRNSSDMLIVSALASRSMLTSDRFLVPRSTSLK